MHQKVKTVIVLVALCIFFGAIATLAINFSIQDKSIVFVPANTVESVGNKTTDSASPTSGTRKENDFVEFYNPNVGHIVDKTNDMPISDGDTVAIYLYHNSLYHNLIVENGEWYFQGDPGNKPDNTNLLEEIKPVDIATWHLHEGRYQVLYNNGSYGILMVQNGSVTMVDDTVVNIS